MLENQISQDYIQAMKDKNTLKRDTLSFLRAQIKNLGIERKGEDLKDTDVIVVIKKQVKQRQDSISQFEKGGREDLAAKERQELEILKAYLPKELSEDEVRAAIDETVKKLGASSMKDMGAVMKAAVPKLEGRADNKMVSDLVRKALS
ncbi:MAG: GatB/YqeY domain-containing protein [Candidatus Aceula meridiana]|nr:GatB/YqeY domain-containing protein [Candidatus Aceula meridiana]